MVNFPLRVDFFSGGARLTPNRKEDDLVDILNQLSSEISALEAQMAIYTERQTISTGNNFDGTVPNAGSTDTNFLKEFTVDDNGGLFEMLPAGVANLAANTRGRLVRGITLKLGGQTDWTLSKTDGTTDITIASGTNETNIVITDELPLAYDEVIKLVTTGSPTGLFGEVSYTILADPAA